MLWQISEGCAPTPDGGTTLNLRTRPEAERFFTGLGLVPPGLVTVSEWYQDTPAPTFEVNGLYVGVARVRAA